jgi:hypothetical protein
VRTQKNDLKLLLCVKKMWEVTLNSSRITKCHSSILRRNLSPTAIKTICYSELLLLVVKLLQVTLKRSKVTLKEFENKRMRLVIMGH